jgi:SAM-dependent methyltransferase
VGFRQGFVVEGVRYRELTAERLRHALSRQGAGSKDYRVAFPGGRSMQIACTPVRHFADITGPRLVPVYRHVEGVLRPGMRVLIVEAGTGYGPAWVGQRVAPSGAVVALDRDHQSILYAQRRYGLPNISFEHAGVEALAGETDGAFDAVIAPEALREGDEPGPALRELWRVVRPGGWMLVAAPPEPWPAIRVRDPRPPLGIGQEALMDLLRSATLPEAEAGGNGTAGEAARVTAVGDGRAWSIAAAARPEAEHRAGG